MVQGSRTALDTCAEDPVSPPGPTHRGQPWPSDLARSAELPIRTRTDVCLRGPWPSSGPSQRCAARHLARTSAPSHVDVASDRSGGDECGIGRGQPAAPRGRATARRRGLGIGRRNSRQRRGGDHRCDGLATHARGREARRSGARVGEHGRDRPLRDVVVGPSPRPPRPGDGGQCGRLRTDPRCRLLGRRLGLRIRHRCRPFGAAARRGRLDDDAAPCRARRATGEGGGGRRWRGAVPRRERRNGGRRAVPAHGRTHDRWLDRPRPNRMSLACSRFACETGAVQRGPATAPLPRYRRETRASSTKSSTSEAASILRGF